LAWTKILLTGDAETEVEAADPLTLAGDVTIVGSGKSLEVINLKAETATELTIATGDITVTQLYHNVDTEADAATDDLVGINGGNDGQLLLLRPNNTARTVVVKHNGSAAAADNILMGNDQDFSMDDDDDMILLVYEATLDTNGAWVEIARNVGAAATLSDTVPNTIEPDDTASAGTASDASRQDHEHAIVAATAGSIAPDATAAEGTATSFARSDHTHGFTCAAPTSVGTTAAEGSGSSFVRDDHVHDLGADCIDSGTLIADNVIANEHLADDCVKAAEIDAAATDITFAQLILTPTASTGTTEGTLFYDSDDNHLYVYVV